MIYLKTNSDGFDSEGIGSVIQWHLLLYGICKDLEINFFSDKFVNISHYQYNNISKEKWSNDYTNFFNIYKPQKFDIEYDFDGTIGDLNEFIQENKDVEKNICIEVDKKFIVDNGFSLLNEIFYNDYLKDIRENLNYQKETYFDPTKYNISIHLRSLNNCDVPTYPSMETYHVYKNANDIKNIFDILKEKYYNKSVCVYVHSQGDEKDFQDLVEFSTDNFQVILKLNQHPIDDIYHMSNSDVFIMSKSSYSWICHLLNPNQTIVRDDFYQPTYPNRVLLDSNYKFNPNDLKLC
jgi:hypothetical protein